MISRYLQEVCGYSERKSDVSNRFKILVKELLQMMQDMLESPS